MKFIKTIFQQILTSVLVALIILIAGLSLLTKKFPPDFAQIKDFQKQLKSVSQQDHTVELMKQLEETTPLISEVSERPNLIVPADSSLSGADKVKSETAKNQQAAGHLVEIQHLKAQVNQLRKENETLREKLRVDR